MVEFGRRSSGRAAARRAAAALERTPKHFDPVEDEVMPDAEPEPKPPSEDPAEDKEEAQPNADDGDDEDAEGGEEAEEEEAEEEEAKSPSPPPVMMIRKKRLGRPPKNRPPDWDPMVEVPMSEAEIAAAQAAKDTPRRRGRGGWRGRGGRKGQQPAVHQQPVDKDGTLLDIVDDEVALPEDPEGETKVDKDGHLQGGREYRCRTFTVAGRGNRLYMLSTEPARCVGFRDSYLFFAKHKRLYKIIVDDEEKRDMIEREIIPHSYKGRAIGIVTARSVFREFGAQIVVGGRRVIDDYEVAKAREDPEVVEGALADPNDHFVPGEPYNKNQYVAWHGASAVYHSNAPVGAGGPNQHQAFKPDVKKRRVAVNDFNWQLEHAREASNFNSMLTAARAATLGGVYDIHTNLMQYPASMQPLRARAVQVAPEDEKVKGEDGDDETSTVFPPLAPQVPRNFFVTDVYLETPPAGVAPVAYDRFRAGAGDDKGDSSYQQSDFLAPFQGLGAVPDDVKDLLPPECRAAFDRAQAREAAWFGRWGDEQDAMCRRAPVIDKAIVPYAMTL